MRQRILIIRSLCLVFCSLMVLLSYPYCDYAFGVVDISSGTIMPQFKLNASDNVEIRQYLGLKNLKSFSFHQISAKLILIEVFSFYCPICHKQAPITNRLYKFIQQDPELSKDIKMIGIGAGNNQKEIDVYKANFRVLFPLFPDPEFIIHKKIGEPRTPTTILITNKGKVLLTHQGVIDDMDEFVRKMKNFRAQ